MQTTQPNPDFMSDANLRAESARHDLAILVLQQDVKAKNAETLLGQYRNLRMGMKVLVWTLALVCGAPLLVATTQFLAGYAINPAAILLGAAGGVVIDFFFMMKAQFAQDRQFNNQREGKPDDRNFSRRDKKRLRVLLKGQGPLKIAIEQNATQQAQTQDQSRLQKLDKWCAILIENKLTQTDWPKLSLDLQATMKSEDEGYPAAYADKIYEFLAVFCATQFRQDVPKQQRQTALNLLESVNFCAHGHSGAGFKNFIQVLFATAPVMGFVHLKLLQKAIPITQYGIYVREDYNPYPPGFIYNLARYNFQALSDPDLPADRIMETLRQAYFLGKTAKAEMLSTENVLGKVPELVARVLKEGNMELAHKIAKQWLPHAEKHYPSVAEAIVDVLRPAAKPILEAAAAPPKPIPLLPQLAAIGQKVLGR